MLFLFSGCDIFVPMILMNFKDGGTQTFIRCTEEIQRSIERMYLTKTVVWKKNHWYTTEN